jgi:hypothetical protein
MSFANTFCSPPSCSCRTLCETNHETRYRSDGPPYYDDEDHFDYEDETNEENEEDDVDAMGLEWESSPAEIADTW